MPRPMVGAIKFNGTTSKLVKTSPTGINNGTDGAITVCGWVKLGTDTLQTCCELNAISHAHPSFGVGQVGAVYYVFSDRVNALNNRFITGAQFRQYINVNRWAFVGFTLDATTFSFFAEGTMLLDNVAISTPISMVSMSSFDLGLGSDFAGSPIQGMSGYMKGWRAFNAKLTSAEFEGIRADNKIPASLVGEWLMDEGTGNVADTLGVNDLTATAATWVNESPFIAKKRVTGNLIFNGDFEAVPTFVAATTTTARWIDGTAAGSLTNKASGWAASGLVSSVAVSFDTSESYSGLGCLKIESFDATGRGGAATSLSTATPANKSVLIPVLPNTSYTYTVMCKTTDVPANSAYSFVREYSGDMALLATNNTNKLTGTNGWTALTVTFTTSATTMFAAITCTCAVAGNAYVARFDSAYLETTVPQTRVAIPLSASAVAATGTITVTDYANLAGHDTSTTWTVTDYTLMAGGNFNILGFFTLTEGVDFIAQTSNDVTATNICNAINALTGDTNAVPTGPLITLTLSADNDGGTVVWSGTGISPTTATLTGGFDATQVTIDAGSFTFGSEVAIGASNDACAANIEAYLDGLSLNYTASSSNNVVTLTYNTAGSAGNTTVLTAQGAAAGTISGGAILSGATFSGGSDAVYGRVLIT